MCFHQVNRIGTEAGLWNGGNERKFEEKMGFYDWVHILSNPK